MTMMIMMMMTISRLTWAEPEFNHDVRTESDSPGQNPNSTTNDDVVCRQ